MSDPSLLETAKLRIAYLTRSLSILQHEKSMLADRERDEMRQLQAWHVIAEAESPLKDSSQIGPDDAPDDLFPSTTPNPNSEVPNGTRELNKTDMVRRFCVEQGEFGFTSKDLRAFLRSKNLDTNPGFPGSFIFRMTNGGELEVVNGRLQATAAMKDKIDKLKGNGATEAAPS